MQQSILSSKPLFGSLMSNFLIVLSNGTESDIFCLKSMKDSLEDPFNYLGSSWNFSDTTESYANNKGLCGGPLKRCKAPDAYDHAFFLNGFAVRFSVSTVVVFALILFYLPIDPLLKKIISSKKRKRNQAVVQLRQWRSTAMNRVEDTKISKLEKLVTRISFTELVNVTGNFREDNIIGLGKTGTMYEAIFPNGSFPAIKRFFESQFSEGHFMSEVMTLDANPTRIMPFREVCDANTFKIATSLIMTGIELPGQLAGVQGAALLGGSGAAPRRGRGVAPPKQNAKMHSKLLVRSSGHSPARAENPWFQKFGCL
ncbi:hypothetical protein ACSBR2_030976 [Camellia fascicularis]